MQIPFIPEDLFDLSDNLDIQTDGDFLLIDNFYKNYDDILSVLDTIPLPIWKWTNPTRNFKDYYDCRPIILNHNPTRKYFDNIDRIVEVIKMMYRETNDLRLLHRNYEFNFFQHIKLPENNKYQFVPHRDTPYASIIYLDPQASGGTAFYKDYIQIGEEKKNLLVDTSRFQKTIVPAKPNRMVVFKGTEWHGGYIEDHSKYLNNWRINQVMFFNYVG